MNVLWTAGLKTEKLRDSLEKVPSMGYGPFLAVGSQLDGSEELGTIRPASTVTPARWRPWPAARRLPELMFSALEVMILGRKDTRSKRRRQRAHLESFLAAEGSWLGRATHWGRAPLPTWFDVG